MTTTRFTRLPLTAAVLLTFSQAHAQTQTPTPLQTITVTGRALPAEPAPAIGGFGDQPLARSPFSASVLEASKLDDTGVRQLGDLTRMDASVNDAYNATGYWSNLAVRGYTLSNRFNYLRDGLPINAETSISLENKASVEVFKGTSGIQAGTSAPGGLVNLVVKRPEGRVRSATVGFIEGGTSRIAVDLGDRFGADAAFGLRVNAAYDDLDTQYSNTQGHRSLAAVAADWRMAPGTLIEAEFESSRQTQPSLAGYSMLGGRVPDADELDLLLNLNDQPWNRPVTLNGNTASLRFTQRLGADWRFVAHGVVQRLTTDDYTAFPFGCDSEGNYDRYCSDGSFDYYQYVSVDEKRKSDALDLSLAGAARTGPVSHALQGGVLFTKYRGAFGDQLFGWAGVGNVDSIVEVPPSADPTYPVDDIDDRSTEFYLRDAMRLSEQWQLWAGLRHTRLERGTADTQTENIPWLALAFQATPDLMTYASWGKGFESIGVPNLGNYANANQSLSALSKQIELGMKLQLASGSASLAIFDIKRPQSNDIATTDPCADGTGCLRRVLDGEARHRGLEGALSWRSGAWFWQASAMWLDAEIQGSSAPTIEGNRPANVPKTSARLGVDYSVAALPGLTLAAALAHEGSRMVNPTNEASIPAWQRLDIGARWQQSLAGARVTWRAGIDNVTDEKAWKESPYQFSHVYLYPLEPRTWRVSAQIDL